MSASRKRTRSATPAPAALSRAGSSIGRQKSVPTIGTRPAGRPVVGQGQVAGAGADVEDRRIAAVAAPAASCAAATSGRCSG